MKNQKIVTIGDRVWKMTERNGEDIYTTKIDPFTVVAKVQYDYSHDFSDGRGKWTDTPSEHSVKSRSKDPYAYKYYTPDDSLESLIAFYSSDHSPEIDGYGEFKALSIQEARKRSVKQFTEDMNIARGTGSVVIAVSINITVSLDHVILGHSALHGLEVVSMQDFYIASCIEEMSNEAMEDTKEQIRKIKAL